MADDLAAGAHGGRAARGRDITKEPPSALAEPAVAMQRENTMQSRVLIAASWGEKIDGVRFFLRVAYFLPGACFFSFSNN